jgi:tetratricopeptide (TPR) repeat protein
MGKRARRRPEHRADRNPAGKRLADAESVDALHLAGLIEYQQGRNAEALRLIGKALQTRPHCAPALANYGMVLGALKRHEEALASFDRVLANGAGDAILHYNRGNALKNLGRDDEALASYERALALDPSLIEAYLNRGNAFAALDRYEDAIASYDIALLLAAQCTGVRVKRANAALQLDRLDEALRSVEAALADEPGSVDALNLRGRILARLHRYEAALASYDAALKLAPNDAAVHSNRGAALVELDRFDEAFASYKEALRIDPDFVSAYVKQGNAYAALNRLPEALASYAAVLAREAQHAEANFNESLARLCLGDFRNGWAKYENRWRHAKFAAPNFPRPIWRGETAIAGKTILLCTEQGMGDVIQFVRYAPLLAARGAKVLLGVYRPLAALMASVPGVSAVIADGETLPDFDLYCMLLSLPFIFGTELATIPSQVPYIRPDPARIEKWRPRVPNNGRLRVCVCWAGSTAHVADRRRSIPLEQFATLLAVPGIDFVSLQKDVSAAQAAILREYGVTQLGEEFADFSDTAAVVALIDLVITVDTSVAHLAGAMGKAVGTLLAFSPDWRWMLDRTDTPWYPTMRLFRQSTIGDWHGPLTRLRDELIGVARP